MHVRLRIIDSPDALRALLDERARQRAEGTLDLLLFARSVLRDGAPGSW